MDQPLNRKQMQDIVLQTARALQFPPLAKVTVRAEHAAWINSRPDPIEALTVWIEDWARTLGWVPRSDRAAPP